MRSGRGTSLLQASMLSMAVAVALVLVWLSSDARAVTTVPEVDENEQGNPDDATGRCGHDQSTGERCNAPSWWLTPPPSDATTS